MSSLTLFASGYIYLRRNRFQASLEDALVSHKHWLRQGEAREAYIFDSTLYGKNDFMTKEELDAHFEAKKAENPAPVVVKKVVKGTGFIESGSSDDEDEPKAKKSKK